MQKLKYNKTRKRKVSSSITILSGTKTSQTRFQRYSRQTWTK